MILKGHGRLITFICSSHRRDHTFRNTEELHINLTFSALRPSYPHAVAYPWPQ